MLCVVLSTVCYVLVLCVRCVLYEITVVCCVCYEILARVMIKIFRVVVIGLPSNKGHLLMIIRF